jgi:hypothetical protein
MKGCVFKRKLPSGKTQFCFVLEVVASRLLVIKHSCGEESGKFVNVAVLQGEEIKVVDQHAATAPDFPELLGMLSELDSPDSVNVLKQLAVSICAHGRTPKHGRNRFCNQSDTRSRPILCIGESDARGSRRKIRPPLAGGAA